MAPTVVLVGAGGLVGGWMLPTFLKAQKDGKIGELRLLSSRPNELAKNVGEKVAGVSILTVQYQSKEDIEKALEGVDIVVSAMGTKEGYHENKTVLLDACIAKGVKVYVPSEFGTDHNHAVAKEVGSPMFESKQTHQAYGEANGVNVIAVYNALFLEISFSAWLNIDVHTPNPTWRIPQPADVPVAFTSSKDIGPFVLSAVLQAFAGEKIPHQLRIQSDSLSLDACADLWEKVSGDTITRNYVSSEEMWKQWEASKPEIVRTGMLGPAIPAMICKGVFDYTKTSDNATLLKGEHAFTPRTVEDFFTEVAASRK